MVSRICRRRFVTQGLHHLSAARGEIDFFRDLLVVHVALDVPPALHLGEYPDRHGMPGKWVEIDPIGNLASISQSVGELTGQNLFHHLHRLIQKVARGNGLSDLFPVAGAVGILSGLNDGLKKGLKSVGVLFRKVLARGERTTGMSRPELLAEDENKPDPLMNGTLIKRVWTQIAVQISRLQVSDHLRRRNDSDLDFFVGIDAAFGEVVAQEEIVDGIVERNSELE